ncbi:MAG: DUF4331 family protein [Myxococcales bacterium]|nr:DUF4331 family protein [Myxococcales bacterium]
MLSKTLPLLTVGLALMGCPSDDSPPIDDNGTGDSGTTNGPTTNPTTTTMTTATTDVETEDGTATGMDTETSTTGPGEAELPEFPKLDPDAYAAVDRMGFPAVNTGLNLAGDKDDYNAGSPADDANLAFVSNVITSLEILHLGVPGSQTPNNTGLDDDLIALALDPCTTPPLPMDDCDDQGAPFVIPDVLEINVGGDPSFPNGRRPAEPVMDIIFAVILLDLSNPGALLTFLDLDGDGTFGPSLNPLENDVPFPAEFPYLAPPHEM